MSEKVSKEIVETFNRLEGEIVSLIEDGKYTGKTAGPVLALLYAETCDSIDMPFEKAVHYVLHVLSTVYGVEMVKVDEEDKNEGGSLH
jgi:transcriptional regulatory protein LevR